jgi:hypothetical protein
MDQNRGQIGVSWRASGYSSPELFSAPVLFRAKHEIRSMRPFRYRSATASRSILPRLLHNFPGIPAFTAWIETGEGLLPL